MELLLLCIKIFLVRILDVSLGTFRTILTVKGKSIYAACIGFIEVFIWFLIVREALNTDNESIFIAISYALGFATGTFIGGKVSSVLVNGYVELQVIISKDNYILVNELKENGYGVSIINLYNENKENDKFLLYITVKSRQVKNVKKLIKNIDKNAFIVVNESKAVYNGYFTS